MPLTRAHIDQIAEKLRSMPPAPPARAAPTTKQEAVRLLAGEIASLQRRGYTLEQITESLRGEGLELTTPTLKSYLARVKARRRRRPAAPPQTTVPALPPRPAATVEANPVASKEAPLKAGKDAFLVKDKDSY